MIRRLLIPFGWLARIVGRTAHMNRAAADAWTEGLAAQIKMRTRITYRVPPTPSGVIAPVSVAREALVWLDDARAFDNHRRRAWQQLRDERRRFTASWPCSTRATRSSPPGMT